MSIHPATILLGVYLALNLVTLLAFGIDKAAARRGDRRIPERSLLLLAGIGGSFGAVLGQRLLRHKTRKQPFAARLHGIVLLHLLLVAAYLFAPAWLLPSATSP